jgi:restriction system protein
MIFLGVVALKHAVVRWSDGNRDCSAGRCAAALVVLLMLQGMALSAAEIHKCEIDGVTTYRDRPCDENTAHIRRTADGVELRASGESRLHDLTTGSVHSVAAFLSSNWYIILIAAAVLFVILKAPKVKGMLGEGAVNLMAKVMLNRKDYHLIRNVTVPTKEGTTQIDHVIVSPYGIFVIETKNMRGWIFGSPNQKSWTQRIYRRTSTFQNPLHQNEKHIQALVDLLSLRRDQMYSVVAFIGDSTFKTPMPDNVTEGRGWMRFVKSRKRPQFSDEEVARIIRDIQAIRLKPSRKTNHEHIQHVKSIQSKK